MKEFSNKFDLEERTAKFSKSTIGFLKVIKKEDEPIIKQLIRSATSIGADYCEANNARALKTIFATKFISVEKNPMKQSIG